MLRHHPQFISLRSLDTITPLLIVLSFKCLVLSSQRFASIHVTESVELST
jgi:hypothetical protein